MFNGYVVKPFVVRDLMGKIYSLIARDPEQDGGG
jgi:hypothetical protein